MAFIHKIVGPDEKLIGIARLHWIYAAKGLAWLIGLMAIGIVAKTQMVGLLDGGLTPVGNAIFGMGAVAGAFFFLFYTIMMLTTELGLTTKRCIYKRGWIFVDVREVDLEEIKSSSVDNGILGRILNYGYIHMDARFIEDVGLPAIADPYRFTKAMNDVRSKIKDDDMRVVLDGNDAQAFSEKRKAREDVHNLEHDDYDVLSDEKKEIEHTTQSKNKKKTDPLQKTVKEHLEEKIIDDFEDVEGKPVKK